MRNTFLRLLILAAFVLSSSTAWGAGFSLTLKGGYFMPSDELFKEVYGGGPVFGAELAVQLAGGLHAWAGAEYFTKKGLLPVTEEETSARIMPVFAGLRYHIGNSAVQPYLGAAAGYFMLYEENPLGTADQSGFGFLVCGGLLVKIAGPVSLDLHGNYSACTVKTDDPDPLEAKIGGLQAGGGLLIRF
jgi:hypothetical protein